MATSLASHEPSAAPMAHDPFAPTSTGPSHHRYSTFDSQLFALGPGASAEQAKRALEAHLVETERRIMEAGKLGTALVQQQEELTERLKEVDQLQAEAELTPDLKQKLVEIEKDYNEVARESARAFLPKQRVPSNESAAPGSPFVPEGKGGRRSVSPSKFESQATASPTKLSVPNRKLRNQPANRVHDIEFAAEISTSLIAQVRNLQALLAEREEELRETRVDKSQLEMESEGFHQRIKSLDESEQRYKDENWTLETQIHDLMAAQKEAAQREEKLTQSSNLAQADKNAAQRELDEMRLTHSRLVDDHAAVVKHHDTELGAAKRTMVMAEGERSAMQRKIDDLTGQNQELARAFSLQRGRQADRSPTRGPGDDELEAAADNLTPEHSPPPSPVKGTPRHSMLESETLKSSLHHAQRTIQSLRTNVHREKTERLELKRMLQEARDELEKVRGDPSQAARRNRKVDSREFRKPLRGSQLGGSRSSRTDLYLDDANWEDQAEHGSPSRSPALQARGSGDLRPVAESSDQFETANEMSDAAFETAHERATETDDFHTGAEEFSDDDDAATETESPSRGAGRLRRPPVLPMPQASSRYSFDSTASTSNDEDDYDVASELKTPTTAGPQQQKMRLRVSRGALSRRSRQPSEEPALASSPAGFANSSAAGTPQQQPAQSLFAELGELEASDDESMGGATPSRRSVRSATSGSIARGRAASPPPDVPPLPKVVMLDSGTMTEPVEVQPLPASLPRPTSMGYVLGGARSDASTQWLVVAEGEDSRPASMLSYSDSSAQHDADMEERLAQFPSPPSSPPGLGAAPRPILAPPQSLSLSTMLSQHVEPRPPPSPPALSLSAITAEHVEPLAGPEVLVPAPPVLSLSTIQAEHVQPRAEPELPAAAPPTLSLSAIHAQEVAPKAEPQRPPPPPARLSFAGIQGQHVEPVAQPAAPLSLSAIASQHVEPVSPREPELPAAGLGYAAIQSVGTSPVEPRSPKRNAFIIPRDGAEQQPPRTPNGGVSGSLLARGKGKGKAPSTPIIAEDETRQSPSGSPLAETPESHRPLKELSANANARPARKQPPVPTADQGAQTSLTAEAIDAMLAAKPSRPPGEFMGHQRMESLGSSMGTPGTVRHHRRPSQESVSSVIRRDADAARRPGSSQSARAALLALPPLPPNHREAIEAARSGSAGGGPGSIGGGPGLIGGGPGFIGGGIGAMGPPLLPASAYKTAVFRPRTPTSPKPMSPISGPGTPTPRAVRTGSALGTADVYSPTRTTGRSRQSSVSSFVSEVEARFNMQHGMAMDPSGFGPNTDPRMIQAITQTMIGEYLWKYTRKPGRGDMSEKRHRRYFWVHPYTRTLYWSDRDPTTAGRAELRNKSVPIEAVRVVTDDNPMPPGLHRKSLIIIAPGRTVKFTCTTGQRHETWFNALSYLLLRTADGGQDDAEEMAGHITRDDVDELNPQVGGRRPAATTRPRPPPSLSSYNSRTTRNDTPTRGMSHVDIPTLTPSHRRSSAKRPSLGTMSRLSGYWRSSTLSGTLGSLRSRSTTGHDHDIYEASEVHDSAEDLRQMYEQQDRESDRMENVRACCDGRHDVGTLTHGRRGRGSHHGHGHSHSHSHPGPSTTPTPTATTPMGTVQSRA